MLVGAVAGIIYTVNRILGMLVDLFALLIGLARVFAGVHHLLNIVGSLLIIMLATTLYWLGLSWWRSS